MRTALLGAVVVLTGSLGACASTGDDSRLRDPAADMGRGEVERGRTSQEREAARAAIGREDILTQMTYWAGDYAENPDDIGAAAAFAEALRQGGRHERAVEVSEEALRRLGDDTGLWRTLGLALLASGETQDALQPLAMWARLSPDSAESRSALGVALDQLERFDQARQAYQEALSLSPDDPRILTNLGVSYLLTGEATEAELVLRQAAALPGAPPEARQNLAIALGLQGRLDEAEAIARVDLPPEMAAANVAYLRGLFEDPRRWDDLDRALRD